MRCGVDAAKVLGVFIMHDNFGVGRDGISISVWEDDKFNNALA